MSLPDYAELHCVSNFSFLRGASHAEELVARAQQLGYAALAITDECSLAGMVRAYAAWQRQPEAIQLIVGTRLQLADGPRLVLLATDRAAYGRLSSLITRGRRSAEKGRYHLTRADLNAGLPGCLALLLPPDDAGDDPQQLARDAQPDLVILDLMLPKLDGLSVARGIRQAGTTPIIMLTARDGEIDRIVGLESGADDYVVKPFSFGELAARIRAVLRRVPTRSVDRLEAGDLTLDLVRRRAMLGGEELQLRHKEFNLLAELMRNQGAVLSRDLLLERVWGYDYEGDTTRTVDVHIRWLREKIEADPSNPQRIQTVRGIGYRFEG